MLTTTATSCCFPALDTSRTTTTAPELFSPACDWWVPSHAPHKKEAPPPRAPMEAPVEPEEDLRRLTDNELALRLCGYYYGCLSWMEASHILRRSPVGTFLVRDSEHCSYLYALSVQTRRGPTSCRIEYVGGRFRLDSAHELVDKMPRFTSVPELVDHYIRLTQSLPKRPPKEGGGTPVWLDGDNLTPDAPVQIYRPLYRRVRSLQHLCRVALVRTQRERHPGDPLSRTIDEQEYCVLPAVLKDYLREYPFSQ